MTGDSGGGGARGAAASGSGRPPSPFKAAPEAEQWRGGGGSSSSHGSGLHHIHRGRRRVASSDPLDRSVGALEAGVRCSCLMLPSAKHSLRRRPPNLPVCNCRREEGQLDPQGALLLGSPHDAPHLATGGGSGDRGSAAPQFHQEELDSPRDALPPTWRSCLMRVRQWGGLRALPLGAPAVSRC